VTRRLTAWLLASTLAAILLPSTVSAQTNSSDSSGTVYVYRYKQFVGMAVKPSVYCDDVEAARMQNGRYFALKLSPGEHNVRSNDTQSGIALQIKAGEVYFVRVELATGMLKGHGRLVMTSPEQGRVEVLRLEPSDHDAVRDTTRVFLDPFTMQPARQASTPTRLLPAPAPPTSSTELGSALANSDIVSLTKAGLGDGVIISKIRSSRARYSLETEDLVALKQNNVSDSVISAMLEASK